MSQLNGSAARAVCPVCGQPSPSSMMLHQNWVLCETHRKLYDDGYLALIECTSPKILNTPTDFNEARRTGKVLHVRRELAAQVFEEQIDEEVPVVFCDPHTADIVRAYSERTSRTRLDG